MSRASAAPGSPAPRRHPESILQWFRRPCPTRSTRETKRSWTGSRPNARRDAQSLAAADGLVSCCPEQLEELKAKQRDRVLDYKLQSLANSSPLEATLGAINGDLMNIGLRSEKWWSRLSRSTRTLCTLSNARHRHADASADRATDRAADAGAAATRRSAPLASRGARGPQRPSQAIPVSPPPAGCRGNDGLAARPPLARSTAPRDRISPASPAMPNNEQFGRASCRGLQSEESGT